MISLLYVSRAAFAAGSEDRQVMAILSVARERNPVLNVTGALIYMGGHFAQVLEGEAAAVNQLMIDILRDRRHRDVRIIEMAEIEERRFSSWGMAWVPPSPGPRSYMDALVKGGSDTYTGAAAAALTDYMMRFAEGPDASG